MDQEQKDGNGYCVVCGCESKFRFDPTIITAQLKQAWEISDRVAEAFNRKESMFCSNCGCSLRIRRLAAVLIRTFSEMKGSSYDSVIGLLRDKEFLQLNIAEINACGTLHSYLKDHPNLYYSEWVSHAKPGEVHDGVRYEDLQRLSYPDGFFDIILTSETLEHVPDPDKAWREIYRTLKIGGHHIFTIPLLPTQATTVTRANLVDGKHQNLLEPAYHGAWGEQSMFVYTDFGMDVVEKLDGMGLRTQVFYQNPEDELDVAVVFRSRKSEKNSSAASAGGSKMLAWTGERYLPWLEDPYISYEHLHRYAYATQFVANKRVLDLASGEGYGSRLLAQTAESVVGVDIDKQAIRHARNKYIKSNLGFKEGSITNIPVDGQNIFDVIVCFEAIEHIDDHEALLKEVKRLLTAEGLFIVSTPNKWAYSDERQYENPFHVQELYLNEFTELLEKHFKQVKILGQRVYCNSNIWPVFFRGNSKLAEYVIERNPREFAFVEGDKRIPLYFIAIASDGEVNENASNLVDISNELLNQKDRSFAAACNTLDSTIKSQQQALSDKDEQLVQLASERERLNQQAVQFQGVLEQKEHQFTQVAAERERFAQEVVKLRGVVQGQHKVLSDKDRQFQQVAEEKIRLEQELAAAEQRSQRLAEYELTLQRIYQSHGWRALTLYYRVRNRLLPEGTRRRIFAKKIFSAAVGLRKVCSLERKSPDGRASKQRLRSWLFARTGSLTENTQADELRDSHHDQVLEPAPKTLSQQDPQAPVISELSLPISPSFPLVSIIIPVYNQLDLTLRCLKSIQDNPTKASAEFIVLDDASEDETPKILPAIPGIRYIRNYVNSGFLRSCNRAAAESRGEYLVFLNNDTQVHKDWLDHMLGVFERYERVGIVGAKLIHPDGRLQEAGGLIWQDASALNFGRDDDPLKPEYNYVRETDYCSAACLMIKASLFHQLTGFDELFAPAYYEDADLAFKVRQSGHKVLYQPAAEVTHFEGGTCGTDINSGVKSYQQINATKFASKWNQALKDHCSPKNHDLVLARDRLVVGRCLFVDIWPTPDKDAGSIYTVHLVKLFQHFSYKITFFPADTTYLDKYTQDLQQMGVECLYEPFVNSLEKYLDQNGNYFDVVVLCRAAQAIRYFDIVRSKCPKAKIIFHTVDLHFLREERAARFKGSAEELKRAQELKQNELEVCAKANCVLVPSTAEVALLAQEVPNSYVECFPFGSSIPGRRKGFEVRQDIAFIAGYLHEPNVDGVTYFVREIWPYIAERLPHVQFLMVGSNMPESVSNLASDRIRAIGYVEDLTSFLESCRLTIAPLRFGAGIKGKIITSLGHGVPVVASPLAVEGMGCEHGVHLLVADTVADWIESIARVYTNENLWTHLSNNGLSLMRETYSLESGFPRLQTLLHRLECPLPIGLEKKDEPTRPSSNLDNCGRDVTVIEKPDADKIFNNSLNTDTKNIRAIAFYLPQYHPIPENDSWWGKGFTEWTYVTRAKPLFPGHYQPHLPSELGFYDLRLKEVRQAQADLAHEHGIYGFCYHYYWFGGKRLLERPLSEMLSSGQPNFPFCLCWANENWTRRWDGREQEILIKQEYSPQKDLAFIQDLLPILSDRRYIRVNGKPLLLIYRTETLPNPKKTAETWRKESISAGLGDLYLCRVESFTAEDPESIGFDAACQFPPLLIVSPELNPASVFNVADSSAFKGKILDYCGLARQALNSKVHYKRFFGVTPSWDNTPRRGNSAYIWLNNLPEHYEDWLAQAVHNTLLLHDDEEQLIFVNAWNEWGESCHLEPDQHHGRAYLEATRRALGKRYVGASERFAESKDQTGLKIVFVSHDAVNAGAQRLLITLIKWLRDNKAVQPKIVLRHGGPLVPEFYRLGPVLDMDSLASLDVKQTGEELVRFCGDLNSLVYINTLVPGDIAEQLSTLQIPILTHVHELENAIKLWCAKENLEALIQLTDHFIAASPPVARNLENAYDVDPGKITTIYEYIKCQTRDAARIDKTAIRKQKGLPESGFIIFGCGTTDWRKGPDLFIDVAIEADSLGLEDYYFFWIGADTGERRQLEANVQKFNLENRVRFLGEFQDTRSYLAAGDVFLLTSREDPFPLVCLEAADCGLPIVCFDKAGGMPDFVQNDGGCVVPFGDTKAMAEKLIALCVDPEERARRGAIACQRVRAHHDVSSAGEEIFRIIEQFAIKQDQQRRGVDRAISRLDTAPSPKVSVIVPNYNHAAYLQQRLDSVVNQTFQDFEVIVLDDASTDRSREIIQTYARYPAFRFFFNESRSGCAFKQWKKGLEEARGEYIWFAESDDYASPDFLSKLVPILESDESIGIVYSQSYLVDPENRILGDALQWTDDLDPCRWRSDFVNEGKAEVKSYLSKKNTIPNASAVLIRASALKAIDYLDDSYGLCGDWLLWIKLLLRSNLGYVVDKLNYWRQQSSNSRSYPPGILEWKEGQRILNYVAQELALSEAERNKMLLDFLSRCSEWAGKEVQPQELFGDLENEFWFWLNTEGLRLSTKLKEILPGMPDEAMQRDFTGTTGDTTLREAFEFYAFVKRYMQEHGKLATACENVLDFGCGWGRMIRFFLKDLEGSRLWGVDCYATALEAARQTNRWCRFEQIDPMPPIRFSDNMFDLIYCFSVFSHLSEEAHELWLVEFHRLLKPGGMLFVTTRGRDFIECCARLRDEQRRQTLKPFLLGPAQSFLDTEKWLAEYDNGKFCYSAVGGGGILDKSFFGEAAIPKGYVLERWTKHLRFVDYISDRTLCPQDIIIVEKTGTGTVGRSASVLSKSISTE